MTLGQKIRELRKNNNLTQMQIAKELKISNGTIAMWETDKREPDISTIKKIANYFNVTTDYLLDYKAHTQLEINITPEQKDWINLFNELNKKFGKDLTNNITEALWKLVKTKEKGENND